MHGGLRKTVSMVYVRLLLLLLLLIPLTGCCRGQHSLLVALATWQETSTARRLFTRGTPRTHLPQLMNGSLSIGHLIIAIRIELEHAVLIAIANLLLLELRVGRPLLVLRLGRRLLSDTMAGADDVIE